MLSTRIANKELFSRLCKELSPRSKKEADNPIEKKNKRTEKALHTQILWQQISSKNTEYMKRYSNSLVIRKMQIKII